ncbi:hypothetical protein [uncultured Pseudacidovorax sp.]|uniref:chorismate transformation enzyme, FkbO/Hyg5 family n=1 Tax=uncultured Pseudacidovorax sp. TaxID=679313 RepID=UPI0025EC3BC8|nr:hypothetical protein [uncultured Pseudacidovorax sp.]
MSVVQVQDAVGTPGRFARHTWADAARLPADRVLGGLAYGVADDDVPLPDWLAPVPAAALLSDDRAHADVWPAAGRVREGRTGSIRWRHDGQHLFGAVELEEDGRGLEALAHRAYRDLFATLADTGCAHLMRLWNYLPRINEDGGGLERYHQFNAGRQQAFIDAGQAAFEGAPAACALGFHGEGLLLRFMAGRTVPVAIENPRQVPAWRYPADYGPRAPTFSRAAVVRTASDAAHLFVSGTASIVGHATVHEGDLDAQIDETLRNLEAVFAESRRSGVAFSLADSEPVVYVRHPAQAAAVRHRLAQALGPQSRFMRQAVYLHADICRRDLLVEIETHLHASGPPGVAATDAPAAEERA